MSHRVPSIAGGLCVAASVATWLAAAAVILPVYRRLTAQNSAPAPPDQQSAPSPDGATVDEYAEAQHALNGPAGNPECVRLGRRVVGLLWNDDLDTAFRHLDLYDRFGCPSGHVQAAFRCLILHPPPVPADPKAADPKAADSLQGRVRPAGSTPPCRPARRRRRPRPSAAAPSPDDDALANELFAISTTAALAPQLLASCCLEIAIPRR